MKKITYIVAVFAALFFAASCVELDLSSPSSASSENWYSTTQQVSTSLNDLYRKAFYGPEVEFWTDRRTDDWAQRDKVYDFCDGSVMSTSSTYEEFWLNSYKAISRAIRVIEAINEKHAGDANYDKFLAEAYFFKAYFYGRSTVMWGDIPYYDKTIDVPTAKTMQRVPQDSVVNEVYRDFDRAIAGLDDLNQVDGVYRITKGAAKAFKARLALYMEDYELCAELCKDIIDSKVYDLYYSTENPRNSYGEFFTSKAYGCEGIYLMENSISYEQTQSIKSFVIRTVGGTNVAQPSWDLLAAYEDTLGKTIDKSEIFNPKNPYEGRDPRCCMTFVKPGTSVYGIVFDPTPGVTTVFDEKSGKMIDNGDVQTSKNENASYYSTALRKGAQMEWRTELKNENPEILMRFADVLLMYAEAKIELGQIDDSVLDAINRVRARAYGLTAKEYENHPSYVKVTDQTELRKILRRERRVEMAWEGRRFWDLRRWGLLEKCYSTNAYGHPKGETKMTEYKKNGYWYWPDVPEIDEDGFADFSPWWSEDEDSKIQRYSVRKYDPKVELFPIPSVECDTLKDYRIEQNPGY